MHVGEAANCGADEIAADDNMVLLKPLNKWGCCSGDGGWYY